MDIRIWASVKPSQALYRHERRMCADSLDVSASVDGVPMTVIMVPDSQRKRWMIHEVISRHEEIDTRLSFVERALLEQRCAEYAYRFDYL